MTYPKGRIALRRLPKEDPSEGRPSGWNRTLTVALVGLVAQALITYIVPNQETPGGVPVKQVTNA